MKRLLIALMLMPSLTLAGTLAPGTYHVKPCPTPVVCEVCPAPAVCAACPVVEQTPCPAATVLPQPGLLPVAGGTPVSAAGDDDVSLVAPAAQSKKLKEWQKWAIGIAGGVALGMIIQHNISDDDAGGDSHMRRCYDCD
jgi:hypothetical protein